MGNLFVVFKVPVDQVIEQLILLYFIGPSFLGNFPRKSHVVWYII